MNYQRYIYKKTGGGQVCLLILLFQRTSSNREQQPLSDACLHLLLAVYSVIFRCVAKKFKNVILCMEFSENEGGAWFC